MWESSGTCDNFFPCLRRRIRKLEVSALKIRRKFHAKFCRPVNYSDLSNGMETEKVGTFITISAVLLCFPTEKRTNRRNIRLIRSSCVNYEYRLQENKKYKKLKKLENRSKTFQSRNSLTNIFLRVSLRCFKICSENRICSEKNDTYFN